MRKDREDSPQGTAVIIGVATTAAIGAGLVPVEVNKASTTGVHRAALTIHT